MADAAFHPDRNLPGCMMPDGGDCCVGYQALLADWRRLRDEAATPSEGDPEQPYVEMLWKWFEDESRCGAEYMRAELPEGLSADDFKGMLDDHEQALLDAAQPLQDEMENYRLALAWIKGQSTDPQAKEIAATALDSFTHTRPHRETP